MPVTTHFILPRVPLTTDFSLWWATTGMLGVLSVLALGLGGCYLAARPASPATPRFG